MAEQSITCPFCGHTSHHPQDVAQAYCGACHAFAGTPHEILMSAFLFGTAPAEILVWAAWESYPYVRQLQDGRLVGVQGLFHDRARVWVGSQVDIQESW